MASLLKAAWRSRSDVRLQGWLPELPVTGFESLPSVDAVIVNAPLVSNALPATLRQLRAATKAPVVIVVYGFANRQVLARLDAANVIALAAPTDPAQLARICQLGLTIEPVLPTAFSQMLMHSAGARRYADAFLLQLSQLPSKVQCGHCREFLEEVLRRLMAHEGIAEPRT